MLFIKIGYESQLGGNPGHLTAVEDEKPHQSCQAMAAVDYVQYAYSDGDVMPIG